MIAAELKNHLNHTLVVIDETPDSKVHGESTLHSLALFLRVTAIGWSTQNYHDRDITLRLSMIFHSTSTFTDKSQSQSH